VSDSDRFGMILRDSLSASDCELVHASDFSQAGNLFAVLRSSFEEGIGLIRVLNTDLCDSPVDDSFRFEAWQEVARYSLAYLVDVSQTESHALRSLPCDLLLCDSISAMIGFIFRMYTIESSLYKNVNHFLRCFPILMVSKFMGELRGILGYIYLLQSSIEYRSHEVPIRENLVVYRGIELAGDFGLLYESMIGDIVVWHGFTSTSMDRDYVLKHYIKDDNSVLFEIELHPGDVAVLIEAHSEYCSEREILIAASTGFEVLSVDYADVSLPQQNGGSILVHIPIVKLNYFLHWYDFDLDERPLPVLV
jgi:hypothetical protein